jgi:hypothetical protein
MYCLSPRSFEIENPLENGEVGWIIRNQNSLILVKSGSSTSKCSMD